MENRSKKGQGMFEYVLLLAGVLLVVILAIVLLRGGLFQRSATNINKAACVNELVTEPTCFDSSGAWNSVGYHKFSSADCPNALDPGHPTASPTAGAYNCGNAINDPSSPKDPNTCNCGPKQ